jgi:Spy/CpxP family protein refolding chaperone
MHGMRGMMHMLRELNLTDAQQQQARAIIDRYEASTKPQRDEMRQLFQQKRAQGNAEPDAQTQARIEALRAQFKESARLMHDELLTILTPEQRTRLEQMKQERKARREERRARRQGQMNDNQ